MCSVEKDVKDANMLHTEGQIFVAFLDVTGMKL